MIPFLILILLQLVVGSNNPSAAVSSLKQCEILLGYNDEDGRSRQFNKTVRNGIFSCPDFNDKRYKDNFNIVSIMLIRVGVGAGYELFTGPSLGRPLTLKAECTNDTTINVIYKNGTRLPVRKIQCSRTNYPLKLDAGGIPGIKHLKDYFDPY